MEQKKSAEASLETKRGTRFLLGLVVVLSVLFVAFEWNSGDAEYDIDETLLDDVAEELLVSTWEDKEQMVAVVEQPPKPQVSEQLKVVDVLPELPPEVEQQALATTVGEMEDLGDAKADEPLPPVATSLDDEPLSVRVVEQLPEISDEKVATAADPLLDAEAMRVVRMMPRWKAGIQNGKPCRTMVAVPIVFDM